MKGCQTDEPMGMWRGAVLPFAILVAIVFVMVTNSGCGGRRPDVTTANTVRLVGHAGVAPLTRLCLEPAEKAEQMSQADALREFLRLSRLGCYEAGKAHTALVKAHEALHAMSEAVTAGECFARLRSAPECDVVGAASKVVRASADFTAAIDAVTRRAE